MVPKKLLNKARAIKLVLLDVDGVMTDGSITYDEGGKEIKSFNVRDGAAIKWLQNAGIEVAVLSGRKSRALEVRAKELGLKRVFQSQIYKLPAFEELLADTRLSPREVACIGDDLHDLSILKRAGLSGCPADAVPELKKVVDYICQAKGGRGAVREFAEIILKSQGQWKAILKKFDL